MTPTAAPRTTRLALLVVLLAALASTAAAPPVPAGPRVSGPATTAVDTAPDAAGPGRPGDGRGGPFDGGGTARSAVGQLLLEHASGEPGSCSAAVVASRSRSLLVTAAHCLYTPSSGPDSLALDDRGRPTATVLPAGWSRAITFQPGRDGADAPFDTWTVDRMWVDPRYRAGDVRFDVAFATVRPLEGRRVADVVGFLGYRVAAEGAALPARSVTALGYPSDAPYDGRTMRACTATRTVPVDRFRQLATCPMTGGASGGPWIGDLDPATGQGRIVAVTSRADRQRGTLSAAPLTADAADLLRAADRG